MSPRGLPAPPDDLPELPSAKLGTKALWRIHAADVAPWFFDVGPDGRFNLAESGTCYLAEEPIGAFVEKFGRLLRPGGVIPEPLVDTQRLSRLRPPKANVVDLTDPTVLGLIGLTAEIHSTSDYNLTQGWALALQEAGYDGIRYKARHDPCGQLVSIALFGSEKPPRSAAKTRAIPVDLIHEASATLRDNCPPSPPLAAPIAASAWESVEPGPLHALPFRHGGVLDALRTVLTPDEELAGETPGADREHLRFTAAG